MINTTEVKARRQGVYWIGTISAEQNWTPTLIEDVVFLKGQLEMGDGGFKHHQIFFITKGKKSIKQLNNMFKPIIGHWELTRSKAAEDYVWKEESRIGEQFEFGEKPFNRSNKTDWAIVKQLAQQGKLNDIEPDIYVRYYSGLKNIAKDHMTPEAMERTCHVFWGPTKCGKSTAAWTEALSYGEVYIKNPNTKWWDGYKGQENVIIDEFRGRIDISYLLTWLDKWPVTVEAKHGAFPLMAKRFWIMSNLQPIDWYPDVDIETKCALQRRIIIKEMNIQF